LKRSSEKKPPSSASSGSGRAQPPKPARGGATTETFSSFVRNLARLEGGGDRFGKGGEGGR
jgi:hypothetical protein